VNEIDKIVADEEIEMTPLLRRAFLLTACDPACHCCGNDIGDGAVFKLAAVIGQWNKDDYYDEMLCENCTVQDLLDERDRKEKERIARLGGGFSRPHMQ